MTKYQEMQNLLLDLCLKRAEAYVIKDQRDRLIDDLNHKIKQLKWELMKMYSSGER